MTIILWFRNDLRIHDHPALAASIKDADCVIPVFIFDDKLLSGKFASPNRNRFLRECLDDLKQSLQGRGADLVIRHGDAATELLKLAKDTDAGAVYYTADYTPYSVKRDIHVKDQLNERGIKFESFGGRLACDQLDELHTKLGKPYQVFTPFWKNWLQAERRPLVELSIKVPFMANVSVGDLPPLSNLIDGEDLSPDVLRGGETEARKRLYNFLDNGLETYHDKHNDMAADESSRISPYLHFGCVSVREIEDMLPNGQAADAWRRQLCWREFYNYIIYKFPSNASLEFQERYRNLKWNDDPKLLKAWQTGQTGYPIVDAAMRQLKREGWMHNRGRLIVGSFLTKDLWIDWRLGEQYFSKMLLDGDKANNNGNWQWIASVGVDPAPAFRRMYNPTSQQANYDPLGEYARRYVPELQKIPDKYLSEPWTMPKEIQTEAQCIIGRDYPGPIVDHKIARQAALESYRQAAQI